MTKYSPFDQAFVDSVRSGGPDVYGLVAEREISDGEGTPCRSCLANVPKGEEMLILAARPFPELQPYAEAGPIFLCANECGPWSGAGLPPIMKTSTDYLLKAYSADNRIIYGTGKIVPKDELDGYARELLKKKSVAYVDVRSARNNCFLTRITRTT